MAKIVTTYPSQPLFNSLPTNAHESDFTSYSIDYDWLVANQYQRHSYVQGWDTNFYLVTPDDIKALNYGSHDISFVGYSNGVFQYTKPGFLLPTSAFARSANNPEKFLKDSTWLMQPNSEEWIVNRILNAKTRYFPDPDVAPSVGWRGLYIDNVGWYAMQGTLDECEADGTLTGVKSVPFNPITQKAYTKSEWLYHCVGMINRINAGLRRVNQENPLVFVNGLGDGTRFFDLDAPTSILLDALVDGGTFEFWLRYANTNPDVFKSEEDWCKDLSAVLETHARGKVAQITVKLWVPASIEQHDKIHRYAVGSFLLVSNGKSNISFSDDPTDRTIDDHAHGQVYRPEWDIDLGKPLFSALSNNISTLKLLNGCYTRKFKRGLVLVNPTNNPVEVILDGVYIATSPVFHPQGISEQIVSINLPANDAAILYKKI